jgi:hypothetical protein
MGKRIESMIPVGIGEGTAELARRGFTQRQTDDGRDYWANGAAIADVRRRWNGDDVYFSHLAGA